VIFPTLHLSNNLKEKKRNINIDLAVLPSHDIEPGVAEDHALLPKVRDGEECSFRVGLIMEDYIYHFGDLSCLVRGAVHVKHWYGARYALGANTLCIDKISVYKVACGS